MAKPILIKFTDMSDLSQVFKMDDILILAFFVIHQKSKNFEVPIPECSKMTFHF
jgi:hypothetical protein